MGIDTEQPGDGRVDAQLRQKLLQSQPDVGRLSWSA